jgi:hypothetical protein
MQRLEKIMPLNAPWYFSRVTAIARSVLTAKPFQSLYRGGKSMTMPI